ncbi:MAG: hypothetical protein WC378_12170, partial [Opitutaceae bacterium]
TECPFFLFACRVHDRVSDDPGLVCLCARHLQWIKGINAVAAIAALVIDRVLKRQNGGKSSRFGRELFNFVTGAEYDRETAAIELTKHCSDWIELGFDNINAISEASRR